MEKNDRAYLKRLLETPSVTGSEVPVASLVRERLADTADEIATDVMGSVHATLKGTADGPSVMLAAHMDEIGLMVAYVSDDGFLSVSAVGGVDAAILPGMRVDVHTAKGPLRGVVGRKPIHLIEADERKKVTPISDLVIDLGMPAKKVKKRVRIGLACIRRQMRSLDCHARSGGAQSAGWRARRLHRCRYRAGRDWHARCRHDHVRCKP